MKTSTILGPDGLPARIHGFDREKMQEVFDHNTRNRARLRARVGPWVAKFQIDQGLQVGPVRFVVREKHDDLLVLGNPVCTNESERDWYGYFRIGQIWPLRGYQFKVQDLYYNSMHLVCHGPTGKQRKGRWNNV